MRLVTDCLKFRPEDRPNFEVMVEIIRLNRERWDKRKKKEKDPRDKDPDAEWGNDDDDDDTLSFDKFMRIPTGKGTVVEDEFAVGSKYEMPREQEPEDVEPE